jgi:hypothetical protein
MYSFCWEVAGASHTDTESGFSAAASETESTNMKRIVSFFICIHLKNGKEEKLMDVAFGC